MIYTVVALVFFGLAYIRFAPSDAAAWHIALDPRPPVLGAVSEQVVALKGAAYVDFLNGSATLDRLDRIARAHPRTKVLAGSVQEGQITWITRSAIFGFADYTTAQQVAGGISVYARLRFGRDDFGVNAARLRSWAEKLSQN